MEIRDKADSLKINFPTMTIEIVGKWIWVYGDTRPHAPELKLAGLFFSSSKKKWFWNGADHKRRGAGWDYNRIVYTYGATPIDAQNERLGA
jgi:hypothetical protein